MSLLALLSSLALAGGPVAIVLPSEAAPDDKALKQHLEDRLVRKGLSLESADAFEHPKALATAFRAHPTECTAVLSEAQTEAMTAFASGPAKGEEVYVVLPTSDKPRQALVWRWDRAVGQAMAVGSGKASPPDLPPAEAPGRLVWLQVEGAREKASVMDGLAAFLGADAVEPVVTDGALVDALLEYPSECAPELDAALLPRVQQLADGVDGDLVLGVVKNGVGLVWRWDGGSTQLRRIATP